MKNVMPIPIPIKTRNFILEVHTGFKTWIEDKHFHFYSNSEIMIGLYMKIYHPESCIPSVKIHPK